MESGSTRNQVWPAATVHLAEKRERKEKGKEKKEKKENRPSTLLVYASGSEGLID